jgi:hypothetical protein
VTYLEEGQRGLWPASGVEGGEGERNLPASVVCSCTKVPDFRVVCPSVHIQSSSNNNKCNFNCELLNIFSLIGNRTRISVYHFSLTLYWSC